MINGESRRPSKTVRTGTGPATASVRPRRRNSRRGVKAALIVVGVLVLLIAGSAGLLYVRLLHGSVSLAGLAPMVERSISEELGGRPVSIDGAEMRIDPERGLTFALTQMTIADFDGTPLALAPEARARLSISAIKRGRIAVEQVELLAPRLHLSYNDDGTLALRFQRPSESIAADAAERAAQTPAPSPVQPTQPATAEARSIDLIKAIAEGSSRARKRETATGYLRLIGARDAVVVVGHGQRRTVLNVPDLQFDLDHRRARSLMSGTATIASLTGPLTIGFSTFEAENSDQLVLDVTVRGLNPRGLGRMIPGLSAAEPLDLTIDGEAKIVLATTGGVRTAAIEARTAQVPAARLAAANNPTHNPTGLQALQLAMTFDGATDRFDIAQLALDWAGSKVTLAGSATHVDGTPDTWAYALQSTAGTLARAGQGAATTRIDHLTANGEFVRSLGAVRLSQLVMRAGGAEVSAKGELNGLWTQRQGTVEGRISAMPIATAKAVWPSGVGAAARQWVAAHVTKGQIAGGAFKASLDSSQGAPADALIRLSLSIETSGLEIVPAKGVPPMEIPRALIRIEGNTVEITAPDAGMTAADGRKLSARAVRFTSVATARGEQPTAEVAGRLTGSVAALVDVADREALQLFRSNGIVLPGLDGRLEGQLKVTFPLAENLQWSEIKSEGRLRLTDLKARALAGPHDLSGGTVAIDIGDKAVDVKGDLLVKGVTGKLAWQYLVNQPASAQPPVRLTATLDTADRNALGMDIDDIVQGEVGIETTLSWTEGGQSVTRVRADLTKAELIFEPIAWRKPPGRAASFQFEPVKGPGTGAAQRLELQNARIAGDDIAGEGWLAIGSDNRVREYSFPVLTLNVVSRLSAHGKLRPDNVWEVKAGGTTFDGRDMFRAMFNLGQTTTHASSAQRAQTRAGLDLTAEVDTVLGFNDTSLRNVRIRMSRRADKLTDLDVKGTLEGGKAFAAVMRNTPAVGRQLLAEGADAGQVFKLVGFYPNAVGGLMQLEVNLDAKGANEKSGILWARDFVVLGDPVVSEVFHNADQTGAQQGGASSTRSRQRVVRQKFEFDGLRIPFDVGAGQFVMNNALLRGPLVGASMRGKIDFKQQQLNIGGTYAPLSGLNAALGGILGPLTGGAQGDGVFGITFAVQGSLAKPEVIVNPLSLLAPGIFREIFQMTPDTFRIVPRNDTAPGPASSSKVRARTVTPSGPGAARSSSSPASEVGGDQSPPSKAPTKSETAPGWSSQVKTPTQ